MHSAPADLSVCCLPQEVDGSSLHMVDFLVQNSDSVNTQTAEGNTALHYCAIYNRPECMKLLLRAGADPRQVNNNGKTPRDIADERGYALCQELVRLRRALGTVGVGCFPVIFSTSH